MRTILIPLLELGIVACLVLAGLLTGCTSRFNDPSEEVVFASELVPFEDLFALEDTLVLDPSVILGHMWFMDVDTDGSILVTDIQSDLANLFAPTGEHQMSFSMDTCYPSDSGHSLWASRFADDDRIILTTSEGAIVVFDRSGDCLAAKQKNATIASFCTRGDSIYAFRGPRINSTSIMDVHSLDLGSSREIVLEPPELPRLNSSYRGISGRDIACFSGSPWYKYHGDMDARAVYGNSRMAKARPDFFVKRDQDLPAGLGFREEREVMDVYPLLNGLYAVDEDIRMGVFSPIDESYRLENVTGRVVSGMSIVSNSSQFKAVSTTPYRTPKTAGNGYLYFLGEHVPMENGEVGNRALIRYRFIPPKAVND
ncbi:MAG: hypothetical protein OXI44_07210 [Bacteroidota bacterium]|nr:hypothetical protein [Bacteroidota bacterium]